MKIYSLFDRKLREYGGLVLCPNDETAKRAIHEGIPPNSTVGKYPEDYDLFYLGEFDAVSGVVKGDIVSLVMNVRDIMIGNVSPADNGKAFRRVMREEVSDALS